MINNELRGFDEEDRESESSKRRRGKSSLELLGWLYSCVARRKERNKYGREEMIQTLIKIALIIIILDGIGSLVLPSKYQKHSFWLDAGRVMRTLIGVSLLCII